MALNCARMHETYNQQLARYFIGAVPGERAVHNDQSLFQSIMGGMEDL
jgi:hypothetical protein